MVSTSITNTMMNSTFKQFNQQILFCECVQVFNPFHLLVELVNLLGVSLVSHCFVLISMPNSIPKRRNYGRLAL